MAYWYERLFVKIALRGVGMVILASAWLELGRLVVLVHASGGETSPAQMLLAAIMVVSASFGAMLTIHGSGLWKPVHVSARWRRPPV